MSDAHGVFISVEGIDGAGKSTQIAHLAAHLTGLGHRVLTTREPGGSVGAEEIRNLLVTGDPGRWSPETEILLFTAARRDHLEATIRPALARGDVVLCDRFADSTRVYQGVARGDLRSLVDKLHDEVIGQEPDLTLILDMDPAVGLARADARGTSEDRFEGMGHGFQMALRDGFLQLARSAPHRCVVIDAGRDPKSVARDIATVVEARLP
ncbi:MAG: dTMP kinase [Pseudomonadota bacterium]